MSDLNPINLLKEDMESDEIAIRVNALHRLKIVATIVPQEEIKNILLPYLEGNFKKFKFINGFGFNSLDKVYINL